jgi:hypothetical protein
MNERVMVNIEQFVLFHKDRISLLKKFEKNKIHGRLIFQVSFLGFESLAKLLYSEEKSSKKRFIRLLSIPSMNIGEKEATHLYKDWRCSLIHQGFIAGPFTTLEAWSEYDLAFLSYPENKLRYSTEYPPESIISIYKNLIDCLEDFFKKKSTQEICIEISR